MKNIIYTKIIALIFISTFLSTCTKEPDLLNTDQEVSFALEIPSTSDLKSTFANSLSDAKKIVLTVQNANGTPTTYNSTEAKIYKLNGTFFSQSLILKPGSYRLTQFILLNSTNKVIYATPLEGSVEAQNVAHPLAIYFNVAKYSVTPINVEVLSTENKSPADFGMVSFPISEVLKFNIGVTDLASNRLLSAKLTISSGKYLHVQMLDSITNNKVTIIDSLNLSIYILTIEKDGYITYSHVFTKDSLKLLNSAVSPPLQVDLQNSNHMLTATDIEGNVYHTVTIGTQVWMVENLKSTRYRNGDLIGTTSPATLDISKESLPRYQWAYDDDDSNVAAYGRLYTWYAITDSRQIAPAGWHIPTEAEWATLTSYLGGYSTAGDKLKETGTTHWQSPNTGTTNETGFTAMPGGMRNGTGLFNSLGSRGNWWTTSPTGAGSYLFNYMRYNSSDVNAIDVLGTFGFSVRCIRD